MIIPRHHAYIYYRSRPRTIYVVPMRSIFHFIIIFTIINLMNTDILSCFLECVLLLLNDNVDEKCE